MAQQRKILIADTSEVLREALRDTLQNSFQLQLCCDGRAALELLRRFQPDVLVLDLMLPGFDGLSLLQAAADADLHPAVLATTRYQNDYILDTAYRLGVSYIMMRPCEIGAMVDRIQDLASRGNPAEISLDTVTQIKRILNRLGFANNLRSYAMLVDAIIWLADHPGAFLSKELYPVIGKRHGTTALSAEKDIRMLIHSTWQRRDDRIWQLYFPPDAQGNSIRPSNSVFLARMVQHLPTPLERAGQSDV